jgi:hypothetical protein
LSERFRRLLRGLWQDLLVVDERVEELDRDIEQIARTDPAGGAPAAATRYRTGDRNGFAGNSWRRQPVRQWQADGCFVWAHAQTKQLRISGAQVHDSRFLIPLVESIPAVKGLAGRARKRPGKLHAN